MKLEIVAMSLLIFVYVRNCSSVNECYTCSDDQCAEIVVETCPENRNTTCMASHNFIDKNESRGCSHKTQCPARMENTTDCYVCDEDLCNEHTPNVTFCYTCINEGCREAGKIETERCHTGKNSATMTGFFCYSMIMIVPLDIFGELNRYSAGCITKKYVDIVKARCHKDERQLCIICNYSLCNDDFQVGMGETTAVYSTFTAENVENMSFGVPEEPAPASAKRKEATCVMLALVLIMVSILPYS